MGSQLEDPEKEEVNRCLWDYADIFAWTLPDMPGIRADIISHWLNVHLEARPVRHKKRHIAPERLRYLEEEEVDKLLEARFIREV